MADLSIQICQLSELRNVQWIFYERMPFFDDFILVRELVVFLPSLPTAIVRVMFWRSHVSNLRIFNIDWAQV